MDSGRQTVFLRGPAGSRSSSGRRIDSLLVERTRTRLAIVAALISAVTVLALVVTQVVQLPVDLDTGAVSLGRDTGPLVGQLVIGLIVIAVALKRLIPGRLVLVVGVLYELYICFNVTFGSSLNELSLRQTAPLVTWAEAMIIFFPLVVPLSPKLTIVAATLAAAMKPLALALASHKAQVPVDDAWLVMSGFSGGVAAMLALFAARIIYGLGRDFSRAQQMGSYRLVSELGAGGMGEVWKASHKMLARPAAVKLIRPESIGRDPRAADAAIERFEREAQATSQLGSPHTIRLYDFGRAASGAFYYVMELLDGLDLSELVRRHGPIAPERAVFLLRGVCHSLAEAHAAGMVHRDIKPANIFACHIGLDYDVTKVLDFGLVAPAARTDVRLTAAEAIVGTPAFIAPEAATGGDLDGRADLYAVGCVLFWMLTGELVFDEVTPMAMAVAHATREPPDIRERADIVLPEGLVALLERCLEKSPDDRPQSAAEISATLDVIEAELEEPWSQQRARAWWRENVEEREGAGDVKVKGSTKAVAPVAETDSAETPDGPDAAGETPAVEVAE